MRISDWGSDVCSSDLSARVEALSAENDQLVEQLEGEWTDGTPEAEVANDRLDEIERELESIEKSRREIDPAVRAQIGTFVYIGGDGEARVHTRMFSEKPVVEPNAPPKATGGGNGDDGAGDIDHGPKLSATLIDEPATQRRQKLVAHIASNPAMALDLPIPM